MVVPLTARGRTLGAMTFVWAESGRQYSTRELELAEELGRRAGLALDHARLFAREHADRGDAPARAAARDAARAARLRAGRALRPSDARDHAGGDWYDAFELPDGRFGIVIGDVGGRGMDAAATMGQIRNSLRAYALKGAGPGEVIDDLHALVAASAGAITFVTVVYVVLDPATGECELASAGHLPPLIVARRRGYVDAPRCPPLGFSGAGAVHARALRARARARRCGCSPTVWSSRAGGRSTSASPRSPRPPAARERRASTRSPTTCSPRCPASRDDDIALLGLRRVGEVRERVAQDRARRASARARRARRSRAGRGPRRSAGAGPRARARQRPPPAARSRARPRHGRARRPRGPSMSERSPSSRSHRRVEARTMPRRVLGQPRLGDVLDVHPAVLGDLAALGKRPSPGAASRWPSRRARSTPARRARSGSTTCGRGSGA